MPSCQLCGDTGAHYGTILGLVCPECAISIEDMGLEEELELEEVD